MKKVEFQHDERLGIEIPVFNVAWDSLGEAEQYKVIYRWEQIRAKIPDRITELEQRISKREQQLQIEDDFHTFCRLSSEISDYASRVIDLNLWFRTQEEATSKLHS